MIQHLDLDLWRELASEVDLLFLGFCSRSWASGHTNSCRSCNSRPAARRCPCIVDCGICSGYGALSGSYRCRCLLDDRRRASGARMLRDYSCGSRCTGRVGGRTNPPISQLKRKHLLNTAGGGVGCRRGAVEASGLVHAGA